MNPSIVAFNVGRCLNALNFHMQQAWLVGGWPEQEARRILAQLAREVRPLVPVREREKTQARISRAIGRLIDQIDTEEHVEALAQSNHELNISDPPDLCGEREWILRPVFEAIDEVRRYIDPSLDDTTRLLLHLGEIVDRAIHRHDVYEYMYEPEELPRQAGAGEPRRLTRGMPRRSPQEPKHYLANVTWRSGELPPDADWAAEVEQVLLELGLIEALPQDVLEQARRIAEADNVNVVSRLNEAILEALGRRDRATEAVKDVGKEDVEEAVRENPQLGQVPSGPALPTPSTAGPALDEEAPNAHSQDDLDSRHQAAEPATANPGSSAPNTEDETAERGPNTSSFLDLRLDEQNHVVTRDGRAEQVKLPGKLNLAILSKLIKSGEDYCNIEMLKGAWDAADLDATPLYGTVMTAVSDLNGRLKSLGLRIDNNRGIGWRLEVKEAAENV